MGLNKATFKLQSEIIQAFRQDNVRGNTIHFFWDRIPITPSNYILYVITRNIYNGQIFLLKKIEADTHHNCLTNMLEYLRNDAITESIWEVKWIDDTDLNWTSHFIGKDEIEVRDKFYFDTENEIKIVNIKQL